MSYQITFELPGLPRTLNARGHWSIKHRENLRWYNAVHLVTLGKRPKEPLARAKLTLTRMSSSEPDFDNLVSGFKPIVDALVRCGILENDKHSNIGVPTFHWEKAAPKSGGVRVIVVEAHEDARHCENTDSASPSERPSRARPSAI